MTYCTVEYVATSGSMSDHWKYAVLLCVGPHQDWLLLELLAPTVQCNAMHESYTGRTKASQDSVTVPCWYVKAQLGK